MNFSQVNITDEFEKLMDLVSIRKNRVEKSILSQEERELIWNLIIELKNETLTEKNYSTLYNQCRDNIINLLRKYNYTPAPPTARNQTGMKTLPIEVKILLWYMAYRAYELYDEFLKSGRADKVVPPTNQAILDLLKQDSEGNPGYTLSKKTFTDFAISPKKYYEMCHYEQIWLPLKYAGEKTGYLGYVINYLAQSAGVYENFLDLFGGSGYATLAVNQSPHIDYYINEYNFLNINYYHVLSDDTLYEAFKVEYQKVLDKIIKSDYDVQDGKKFFNHCEKVINNCWHNKYPSNDYEKYSNQLYTAINNMRYVAENDSEKVDLAIAFIFYNSFKGSGKKSQDSVINNNTLESFCKFPIENYDKAHAKFRKLRRIYNSDALYQDEFIIEEFHNKVPSMYLPFNNDITKLRDGVPLSDNLDNEYKESLLGVAGRLGYSANKKPRGYRTLIYSDSPYLETSGYGIDKTEKEVECADGNSDSLYLETSGYGINKTEKEVKCADGNIDVDAMKTLIKKLMEFSVQDNHFIFSCRATAGKTAEGIIKIKEVLGVTSLATLKRDKRDEVGICIPSEGLEYETKYLLKGAWGKQQIVHPKTQLKHFLELLSSNQSLYENLFLEFKKQAKEYKKQLYVLVCLDKNYDTSKKANNRKKINKTDEIPLSKKDLFEKILGVSDILEAFITDFNFTEPFDYKASSAGGSFDKSENYSFYKMTLDDFCDLLKKKLLRSTEAHLYKVVSRRKSTSDGYIEYARFEKK